MHAASGPGSHSDLDPDPSHPSHPTALHAARSPLHPSTLSPSPISSPLLPLPSVPPSSKHPCLLDFARSEQDIHNHTNLAHNVNGEYHHTLVLLFPLCVLYFGVQIHMHWICIHNPEFELVLETVSRRPKLCPSSSRLRPIVSPLLSSPLLSCFCSRTRSTPELGHEPPEL